MSGRATRDLFGNRSLTPVSRSLVGRTNVGLMNNVAFALIEVGRLDEAERCIALVSHALHRDPYLTATLGLLNFRRGKPQRGEALYKEAISLARSAHDRNRIKQKMYLEIGRQSSPQDARIARKALERVLKEKRGEPALVKQATKLLRSIPRG